MGNTRIYNRVMQANDVCPLGELLTDKELERMKLNNPGHRHLFTMKVRVKAVNVYFSFGVRFTHEYELLAEKHTTEELERILMSVWGKALDSRDYSTCVAVITARKAEPREFQPGDYVMWHGYEGAVTEVFEEGIVIEVCGEEIFTDIDELREQQL